jgi:hypothetical protein
MEISISGILVLGCVIIVTVYCAAFYRGKFQSRGELLVQQNEYIAQLKVENRDLLNKVLLKHGTSALGIERTPPKKSESDFKLPRVVMRGQMEDRERSTPTIHATNISYPTVKRETILEKASEIIDATK